MNSKSSHDKGEVGRGSITPFVKRDKFLCPRTEGYSTALSSRYEGWGGLWDNHGQHTVLLVEWA